MGLEWDPDIILLGTGGKNPRVEMFDPHSGVTDKLIDLDPGHSAYAIDINSEQDTIAVGTKGGFIRVLDRNQDHASLEPPYQGKLVQGAPILAICWTGKGVLAASDIAGRCLLWNTNQNTVLQPLEVMEGDICSLIRLRGSILAGLSSEGGLHFWQTIERRLLNTVKVPKPPDKKALVRITYWPVTKALVFPGLEGCLTIFYLKDNTIKKLHAHRGDLYAVSMWKENLLTVGMEDGYLKLWQPKRDKPSREIKVSKGIITASFADVSKSQLLLIDKHGEANIYTLDQNGLRLIKCLPGKDYRAITTPDLESIQTFYVQKREQEVTRIIAEINDKIDQAPNENIARLHSRLVELGYEHISLQLLAEQAEKRRDLTEALECRTALVKILPKNDPRSFVSLERYAVLLEKLWHLTEAEEVCRRIIEVDANYRLDLDQNTLESKAHLAENTNVIIESDIPIENILTSADIIGKTFIGRYLIKRLSSELCRQVKLSPKMVAEKYNMLLEERENGDLPKAALERTWWMSRESVDEIEIITFGNGQTNSIKGLQFALQVSSSHNDSLLSPLILFDWRHKPEIPSSRANNDKASDALKNIGYNEQTNLYLSTVHETVKYAIRRLINESLSKKGKL